MDNTIDEKAVIKAMMDAITDEMVERPKGSGEALPVVAEIIEVMVKHKAKLSDDGIIAMVNISAKLFTEVKNMADRARKESK